MNRYDFVSNKPEALKTYSIPIEISFFLQQESAHEEMIEVDSHIYNYVKEHDIKHIYFKEVNDESDIVVYFDDVIMRIIDQLNINHALRAVIKKHQEKNSHSKAITKAIHRAAKKDW